MKKIYIQPEMAIIKTNINNQLLAGSNPPVGGTTSDVNDLLAPELYYDDEDF